MEVELYCENNLIGFVDFEIVKNINKGNYIHYSGVLYVVSKIYYMDNKINRIELEIITEEWKWMN